VGIASLLSHSRIVFSHCILALSHHYKYCISNACQGPNSQAAMVHNYMQASMHVV